jgi:hypothetical protein
MPGFNATGPLNEGQRTGRRLGHCGRDKETQRPDDSRYSGVKPANSAAVGRGGERGRGRGQRSSRGGNRRRCNLQLDEGVSCNVQLLSNPVYVV